MTPSDSMTSSVASASNGAVGMMTVVAPSISEGGIPPMPAMWNMGALSRNTCPSPCRRPVRIAVIDAAARLPTRPTLASYTPMTEP